MTAERIASDQPSQPGFSTTVVHVECLRPQVVVSRLVTGDGLLAVSTCLVCGGQVVRHDRPTQEPASTPTGELP